MLLGTLASSILGNELAGKRVTRAAEEQLKVFNLIQDEHFRGCSWIGDPS